MKNKIFSWTIKLGIIAVIGLTLFCLGRIFNHFPKHEAEVAVAVPIYEVVKTALMVLPTFAFSGQKQVAVAVPVSPSQSGTIPVYEATKTSVNQYEIIRRAQ